MPPLGRTYATTPGNTFAITFIGSVGSFASAPAALTEWGTNNLTRSRHDLSGMTQFRYSAINVNTVGAAGCTVRVRYSLDGGTTWFDLDAAVTTVAISTLGHKDTAWLTLDPAAATDVILALWEVGGNGAASPVIANAILEFAP